MSRRKSLGAKGLVDACKLDQHMSMALLADLWDVSVSAKQSRRLLASVLSPARCERPGR